MSKLTCAHMVGIGTGPKGNAVWNLDRKHSAGGMQLPDTSEWLCTETGLLRSQFASLAVDQLAASIVSILSSHGCPHDSIYLSQDRADTRGIPPQVLKELSEMCIPILHFPKALIVVEALLQCKVNNPALGDLSESTMMASGLSLAFLEAVTALQRGGENGYTSQPTLNLSYEARTNLWRRYLPSFEQELLDLVEAVRVNHARNETIKTLLFSRELPKSCLEHQQLFIYCEEFFRVLFMASRASQLVVQLVEVFNSSLAAAHSQLKIPVTVRQFDVHKWISEIYKR